MGSKDFSSNQDTFPDFSRTISALWWPQDHKRTTRESPVKLKGDSVWFSLWLFSYTWAPSSSNTIWAALIWLYSALTHSHCLGLLDSSPDSLSAYLTHAAKSRSYIPLLLVFDEGSLNFQQKGIVIHNLHMKTIKIYLHSNMQLKLPNNLPTHYLLKNILKNMS